VADNPKPQDDEDPLSDEETATRRSEMASVYPQKVFESQLYLVPVDDASQADFVKLKDDLKAPVSKGKYLQYDQQSDKYYSGFIQTPAFKPLTQSSVDKYYKLTVTADPKSLPPKSPVVSKLIKDDKFYSDGSNLVEKLLKEEYIKELDRRANL
jgi:hypothetical protein